MYLNIFITCLTFSCALAHFFPLYRYQYNSPIYSTSYSSQQKPFSNNLSSGQYSAAGNVNVKPGYYSTYWYTNGGTKWRPFKYWLGRLSGLFNSGQHSANIGGYLNWKVGGGTNQYNQFNKNAGSYTLQTGGVPQYYYKGSGYTGYSGSGGYNSQYSNGGQGHYSQSSAQYGHGQTGLTDNSGGSSGRLELLYPYQHGSSSIQTQSSTSNVHTGQTSHSGQFSAGYDYGQTGLTDNSGGSSGKLELLYPYQHGSSSTQTQFSSSNVHTGQKSHPGQFSAGYDYGQTGLTDISGSSSGKLELLYPYQHGSSSTQTQSSSSNVHTGQISHSGQFSAGYDYGQTGLTDNSGGSSGKLELLYPSQHGSSSTQSSFSKVHTETKGNSNQPTDNYDLTGGTENSGKSTIEQVHTETIGNSNQPTDNYDLTEGTENSGKSTIEQIHTETIDNSNQPTDNYDLTEGTENSGKSTIEQIHTETKGNSNQPTDNYDFTGGTENSGKSTIEQVHTETIGNSNQPTDNYDLTGGTGNSGKSTIEQVHTETIGNSNQPLDNIDLTGDTGNSGKSTIEQVHTETIGNSNQPTDNYDLTGGTENSGKSTIEQVHTETIGNSNQPTDNYDLTGGTENSGKSTIEQVHTETIGNSNQPLDNIDLTGDTGNSDKSTIEQVYTETIGNSNQPTAKHGLPNGNGQLELTSPIDHSNDNQIITESKVLNLNNELPEEPIVNGQAKGTFESNKGTAVLETATESVVTVTAEIIDYNQRKTTSSSEAAIFNDTIIFPDDKRLHGTSFKANSQTEIKSTVPNSKANRSSKNGILTPGQIGASLTSVRKSENCAGQQGNTQSADSTINIALNVEKEINSKSHGNQTVPVIIKPVVVVAPIAVPSACCPNAAVPCSSACPA